MSDDNFVGARMSAMGQWFHGLKPASILDLGGRASTAEALRARFADARIVVVNLEKLEGSSAWRPVQGDGERLPFRSGSFDLIFCSEVVEHVVRLELFMAEARRVMRAAGHLFVTTPNLAAWHNRLLVPLGYPPANYTAYPNRRVGSPAFVQSLDAQVQDHIRVFTRAGLIEALAIHGFQVREDKCISYAVKGRPMYKARRVIDKVLPKTWKEDILLWARPTANLVAA